MNIDEVIIPKKKAAKRPATSADKAVEISRGGSSGEADVFENLERLNKNF